VQHESGVEMRDIESRGWNLPTINPINFIAKHIEESIKKPIEQCENKCAFTNLDITEGVRLKKLLATGFTDSEYIKNDSEFASVDLIKCYTDILKNNKGKISGLRNYSFLCTDTGLRLLKKVDFIPLMLDLPKPPFILAYSFNNKKHISYKSRINYNKEEYFISTDTLGNVKIYNQLFLELYPIIQSWYTRNKETHSINNTYFTKSEILQGSENLKKIKEYGFQKFKKENEILSRHRRSLYFTLITRLINIKEL